MICTLCCANTLYVVETELPTRNTTLACCLDCLPLLVEHETAQDATVTLTIWFEGATP